MREREGERAALTSAVAAAAQGSGVLIVIDGASGTGRSALLRWLAGGDGPAVGTRVVVRSARATLLGRDVPFSLVHRLLEPAVAAAPELLDAGWAGHARPLFDPALRSANAPSLLVEGTVALIGVLIAREGPLLLALDDVQWLDPSSLAVLVELAQRRDELGLGLVLAVNGSEPPVDAVRLAELRALAGVGARELAPLSAEAVRQIVAEHRPQHDEAQADAIVAAAAGNPRLVIDLLDAVSGERTLAVPATLPERVLGILSRLGDGPRGLAQALAVLEQAPLHRVAALARMSSREAEAAADQLIGAGIVAAGEPLQFAQPVLAPALEASLPPFELSQRHRRAAALLHRDGGKRVAVATHLLRARPDADPWVTEQLLRAAEESVGCGDPDGAARLLERALAEPPAAGQRGSVLLALARARAASGRPEAIGVFEQALGHLADRRERAEAWHALSRLLLARGEQLTAAEAARRGGQEFEQGDPQRERLLAIELAAGLLVPELAPDAFARVHALLQQPTPGDPGLISLLAAHRAWEVIGVEQIAEMVVAATRGDPLVDSGWGGVGLAYLAGALNWMDDTTRAIELLDAGIERTRVLGDPLVAFQLLCTRAWAHLYRGAIPAARADLEAAGAIDARGWPSVAGLHAEPLIVLRLEEGDVAGARAALQSPEMAGPLPWRSWYEGLVAAAAGDDAAALAGFLDAGEHVEQEMGMTNPGVLQWRAPAAAAALRLGRPEQARELVAVELEQSRRAGVGRALGIGLRISGLIEQDLGRLQESVEVLRVSPARLSLARSLMYLGVSLRHQRRAREARVPLTEALELAEACGAPVVAERALAELRAAGARPRRTRRWGAEALTASERNVAQLAASGRTTRQIAAELYLSPKTVEGHLTSTYRKLQISSRDQLGDVLTAALEEPA